MKVISFANQKGGVGKTTLSINFAHWLTSVEPEKSIVFYDLDPQASAVNFFSESMADFGRLQVYCDANVKSLEYLHNLDSEYDYVICDTAPRLYNDMKLVADYSHCVVLPTSINALDQDATEVTLMSLNRLVREKVVVLPNRIPTRLKNPSSLLWVNHFRKLPTVPESALLARAFAHRKTVFHSRAKSALSLQDTLNETFTRLLEQV